MNTKNLERIRERRAAVRDERDFCSAWDTVVDSFVSGNFHDNDEPSLSDLGFSVIQPVSDYRALFIS